MYLRDTITDKYLTDKLTKNLNASAAVAAKVYRLLKNIKDCWPDCHVSPAIEGGVLATPLSPFLRALQAKAQDRVAVGSR